MFVLLVSGLGYGIISGLFAMVNVLADITGPGSLGLKDDVPQNFLIVSGKLCKFKVSLRTQFFLFPTKDNYFVDLIHVHVYCSNIC